MQEGNQNIQLAGYNLRRADYPSNSKRGGVYIFHEKTLGVCLVKSLWSLYKIARVMFVLYIGLEAKIVLNLKMFL